MKKYLQLSVFIVLLFFAVAVIAQNSTIDSLEQQLTLHADSKDTVRIKILNELAKQFLRVNPDKAVAYSNEAIQISQKTNYKTGISAAYNTIGTAYRVKGKYAESLNYHQKALGIDLELKDKNSQALSLNNIGNIYLVQSIYDKALENYFKSLSLRQEINDKNGIATSFNNIGLVFKN